MKNDIVNLIIGSCIFLIVCSYHLLYIAHGCVLAHDPLQVEVNFIMNFALFFNIIQLYQIYRYKSPIKIIRHSNNTKRVSNHLSKDKHAILEVYNYVFILVLYYKLGID